MQWKLLEMLDTVIKKLQYIPIENNHQIMKEIQIPQIPIVQDSKSVSGKRLISVKITRDKDGGLSITLTGDSTLWKPFRRDDETYTFAGQKCFYPAQMELRGVRGMFDLENQAYESNGFPNLAMLLACDMDNGATFNFGAFPVSEQKLYEWTNLLKQQVKCIFCAYIKPVNVEMEVTCATIEVESHT